MKEEEAKQEVLVLRGGFSEFQDKYKVSRPRRSMRSAEEETADLCHFCNCAMIDIFAERPSGGGEVRCIGVGVQELDCRSHNTKLHDHILIARVLQWITCALNSLLIEEIGRLNTSC